MYRFNEADVNVDAFTWIDFVAVQHKQMVSNILYSVCVQIQMRVNSQEIFENGMQKNKETEAM